jgi:hypothetical protein
MCQKFAVREDEPDIWWLRNPEIGEINGSNDCPYYERNRYERFKDALLRAVRQVVPPQGNHEAS